MNNKPINISFGVKWVGIGRVGGLTFQIISLLTLARLLEPSDYGMMAVISVVTSFAGLFRDMGMGTALIQKEKLSIDLSNTVFWCVLGIGAILSLLLFISASFLSDLFEEPRLHSLFLIVSPVLFISSFGIVPKALLERRSAFEKTAIIEICSGVAGLALAITLALKGFGVLALIAQSLVSSTISSVLLWVSSKWKPAFSFDSSSLSEVWRFSSNIFVFNCINYFHRNADTMIIGRFLGVGALGYYNIAYKILLFPLENITAVVNRAMLPAYSREQGNIERIADHYLSNLQLIAFFTAPMMAMVWALREPLLISVLGEQWLPASKVIAWLAPIGFLQSLISTSGTVFISVGRTDILRNLAFVGVPFLTLSFVLGMPWGIEGVAAAYCIATFLWMFPVIKIVLNLLSKTTMDFLRIILPLTTFSIGIGLLTRYFGNQFVTASSTHLAHLGVGIIAFSIIYGLFSWFFLRSVIINILPATVIRQKVH